MGFASFDAGISATQGTPFFQALHLKGTPSLQIAFHLARPGSGASGGTFTLGGTNSSLFTGNIEYLLATAFPFWGMYVSGEWACIKFYRCRVLTPVWGHQT